MSRSSIAFIGQCHTSGYPGVPPHATFPQVCRRAVESCRPGARVDVVLEPYQHPAELPEAVARALQARPRVVVIEVIGWMAVTGKTAVDLSRLPKRVRTAYQRMRHFREVTHAIGHGTGHIGTAVFRVQATGAQIASGLLRKIVHRYPRPSLEEYERFLRLALEEIALHPNIHAVIQGPGAPNLDLDARGIAPDAVERYRAVEAMARRVAEEAEALYVDRWDSVDSGFFLDGSIRPTAGGHDVWGNLLARELLTAGLV